MINNSIFNKLFSVVLLAALMSGCMHDETDRDSTYENQVTFRVEVSGAELPSSRAMSGGRDYEVGDVDVLLFKIDGTTETYLTRKSVALDASNIVVTGSGDNAVYNIEFSTTLPSAASARVVLIANAKAAIDAALVGATTTSSKREILEKLEVAYTDPWPANGSGTAETTGGYKRIPMYGESNTAKAVGGGVTIEGIKLIRMLAAIDVTNTASNFQLTGVYLINPNTKGRVSPMMDANGKTSYTAATTPHLPDNPQDLTAEWPPFIGSLSSSEQSMLGEIYTFETAAASDATQAAHDSSVCLILKGKYNDGAETFYRVDFTYDSQGEDASEYQNYMPLLRNYRYVVAISSALGKGFATIEQAKASYTTSSNLKTSIIHYDRGEVKNVQFDNGHMLAVSETSLEFTREGGEYILKIATTRPEGWSASVSSTGDWLKIAGTTTGVAGTTGNLKLTCGATTAIRTGEVTIEAGYFKRTITVKQNDIMPALTLKVTDIVGKELSDESGLTFPYINGRGTISAQKLVLSWSPAEAVITASLAENGGFEYDIQSDNPESFNALSGSGREHVFDIMPTVISDTGHNVNDNYPNYHKIIKFTATFNGSTVEKMIRLEQIACGYNGNAMPMMIGNREYLTYRYGNRCWMVENSKEGNPSQTTYASNVISSSIYPYTGSNGYWYHWGKAASACPAGWHLPTNAELSEMKDNIDINKDAKWWYGSLGVTNNAFAGYMNYITYTNTMNVVFDEEGKTGYWWGANEFEVGAKGNNAEFNSGTPLNSYLASVRCVRNEPGVSYLNVDGVVPYYARNKDGQTTYTFFVKSNVAWRISSSGTGAGSVSPSTGGSAGTDTKIAITYTVPAGTDEGVKVKTLSLTIADENDGAPQIIIPLNTVDCGTHGKAFKRIIGGNEYQTHMYGNQCWMVDNLKGGPNTNYTYGGGPGGPLSSGVIYEIVSSTETNVSGTGDYIGFDIRKVTNTWTEKIPYPPIGAFEGDYYEESEAINACPSGWLLPKNTDVAPMEAEVNSLRMVPGSSAAFWFKDVKIGDRGTTQHISDDPSNLSVSRMSQGYCDFAEVAQESSAYSNIDLEAKTATLTITNKDAHDLWDEYRYLWRYDYYKNAYYWLGTATGSGRLYFYVDFNNTNNVVRNFGSYVKNKAMCIRCVKEVSK